MNYVEWVDKTFARRCNNINLEDAERPAGTVEEIFSFSRRFFSEPLPILSSIDRANAKRDLTWFPSIDGYLGLLSSPLVSADTRVELALHQADLFINGFVRDGFDGADFMWWEHLVGASWADGPIVSSDLPICNAIIDVCERIFAIPSDGCRLSALHGLNEFMPFSDRDCELIIRRWLAEQRSLPTRVSSYAKQVLSGNAQ